MTRKAVALIPCLVLSTLCLHCGSDSAAPRVGASTGGASAGESTIPESGSSGSAVQSDGGASVGGATAGSSPGGAPSAGADPGSGGADSTNSAGAAGASASGAPGAAGAAGTTGSAGAGPSATCPTGALLCEDFESYAANAAPTGKWKVTNVGTPTTVIDTMHAYSGSKAAHFHGKVSNNQQYSFLTANQAPTFPVTSTKLFVRFMLYITQWPSATATHTRLAWLGTNEALSTPQRGFDGGGYDLCNYNGIAIERFASGYYRNTSANMRDMSRVGKWNCFEMEIDNAGGPPKGGVGTALPHIFENDKEYTLALAGDNSVAYNAIKFEALQFSLWSPQTDTVTADYWIDDVVMSSQRIMCPAQ